ncbi:MAG TPA: thiamine pyrophosphate-dependent enzyme [Phycisphaerae bacterium]|nr:thiamine pyrophosphate-dependent enzyme [Phycisphaerae bacterium]
MPKTGPTLKIGRPKALLPDRTHYCAGCGHGVVLRILAEIIDEWGIRDRMVGMAPVGCAVLLYQYLDIDMCEAAHGRTPEVAAGIKRARPDLLVFSYQGDGDLAGIGTNEIVHVANRGEPISVIFINNAVYGMTGGQMAPTTMPGQKTTTTPKGRSIVNEGFPLRVSEMLATLEEPVYIERCVVGTPRDIRRTKNAIKKSLRVQRDLKGFSLIEILSPCPTYWRVPPNKAVAYIEEYFEEVFPRGVIKDKTK